MEHILTKEQMKRCDRYTVDTLGVPSETLMERAARAAFGYITESGIDTSRTLVVCGGGNNGGDGFALALLLREADVDVSCYFVGSADRMTAECRRFHDECRLCGITFETGIDFSGYTLIIDAIIGIGFHGELSSDISDVICAINASSATVIALDIASGVNSNTGAAVCAVNADATVAFAYRKPGHILYPGCIRSGEVIVADIGIGDEACRDDDVNIALLDDAYVKEMLPKRRRDSHKGTFGRVLVAAGSAGMFGAAYLSSLAAYRSGAGLVETFTPDVNIPMIQAKLPEAIACGWGEFPAALVRERVKMCTSVVIGPGLGKTDSARDVVEEVLFAEVPAVVDADALNIIAQHDGLEGVLRARGAVGSATVVTPHPAEMARLTDTEVSAVLSDPIGCAMNFARENGVVCLLKGAVTVVTDGAEVMLVNTGSNALSKGGSGDVLAGMIGALIAEGAGALEAAAASAYLHGKAGVIAARESSDYSVLASEVADSIGRAIMSVMNN